MALDKGFLESEKNLVSLRLECAIKVFYENPTESSMYAIFTELSHALIYNLDIYIPTHTENGKLNFVLKNISNIGYAYVACTNTDELVKCPEKSNVVISIRKLFDRVDKDSLSGIVLNPYSDSETIIFLNKQNVKRIIAIAFETINSQPDDIREFLLNEI